MTIIRTGTSEQEFLISIRVSAQGFASHWPHCLQVADYLAAFASTKHPDPKQFSQNLSSILKQVLGAVFHYQERTGEVVVTISSLGQITGIRLEFPVDYATKTIYTRLVQDLRQTEPQHLYQQELARPDGNDPSPVLGFLQVATQYPAKLAASSVIGRNAIQLYIRVALDAKY